MWIGSELDPLYASANEESGALVNNAPLAVSEEKSDMIFVTSKGCYKFPFEDEFKVLVCGKNRQGKTCDAVEERMQSANKAFWKDIMIFKSKDVPWKVKCQRLVDHVYAVKTFGSENWSWMKQTIEKIKGWETKTMTRLFRLKR